MRIQEVSEKSAGLLEIPPGIESPRARALVPLPPPGQPPSLPSSARRRDHRGNLGPVRGDSMTFSSWGTSPRPQAGLIGIDTRDYCAGELFCPRLADPHLG